MVRGEVIMIAGAQVQSKPNVSYQLADWEEYARIFSSITTPAQMEVYEAASSYLHGSVFDAGSGTGKIAHYLKENGKVTSYTGADYSKSMVEVGNEVLQSLAQSSFSIEHCKIEDMQGCFDSAVSIQSFYTWPEPYETLKHIYDLLVQGAIFVLATANDRLNLEPLIKDADKVLAGHPFRDAYKQYNIDLAENTRGNFISLDKLIRLVQQVGFRVINADQKLFHGSLNFLVLER